MIRAFFKALIRYHQGLAKMPPAWKPWLISLLVANMIAPLCWFNQLEAQIVFGVALLNATTFVILTAISGFSRLLGLAHIYWIPLICFLWMRLDLFPPDTAYGFWIRAVIVLDAGSVMLDASNVVRYLRGEREEMVTGL
jgi:hypothetical protein